MIDFFWVLLPAAAISGWFFARMQFNSPNKNNRPHDYSNYFKGLNFLINEQSNKAIQVFTEMLEVDNDTIEIHIALGNLFRRRGEVDRAIQIHQNLVSRPSLDSDQRAQALLELGQDFMKAGLFGRAERFFQELVEIKTHNIPALRYLITIYEQEKEWEKAIATSENLQSIVGENLQPTIAHYYCELAEKSNNNKDFTASQQWLKAAQSSDENNIRMIILVGHQQYAQGDYKTAINTFKSVVKQLSFFSEVLDQLAECYKKINDIKSLIAYLAQILEKDNNIAVALLLCNLLENQQGNAQAINFITKQLHANPSLRGLEQLIALHASSSETIQHNEIIVIKSFLTNIINNQRPSYMCSQCGFSGTILYWQCPRCKSWGKVTPT